MKVKIILIMIMSAMLITACENSSTNTPDVTKPSTSTEGNFTIKSAVSTASKSVSRSIINLTTETTYSADNTPFVDNTVDVLALGGLSMDAVSVQSDGSLNVWKISTVDTTNVDESDPGAVRYAYVSNDHSIGFTARNTFSVMDDCQTALTKVTKFTWWNEISSSIETPSTFNVDYFITTMNDRNEIGGMSWDGVQSNIETCPAFADVDMGNYSTYFQRSNAVSGTYVDGDFGPYMVVFTPHVTDRIIFRVRYTPSAEITNGVAMKYLAEGEAGWYPMDLESSYESQYLKIYNDLKPVFYASKNTNIVGDSVILYVAVMPIPTANIIVNADNSIPVSITAIANITNGICLSIDFTKIIQQFTTKGTIVMGMEYSSNRIKFYRDVFGSNGDIYSCALDANFMGMNLTIDPSIQVEPVTE